jgi:hypothetical protein
VPATTDTTGTAEFMDTSTTDTPSVSGNPTVVSQVAKDPGMASASATTPSESPSQSIQNSMDGPAEAHEVISTMESIVREPDEPLPEVSVFKIRLWLVLISL